MPDKIQAARMKSNALTELRALRSVGDLYNAFFNLVLVVLFATKMQRLHDPIRSNLGKRVDLIRDLYYAVSYVNNHERAMNWNNSMCRCRLRLVHFIRYPTAKAPLNIHWLSIRLGLNKIYPLFSVSFLKKFSWKNAVFWTLFRPTPTKTALSTEWDDYLCNYIKYAANNTCTNFFFKYDWTDCIHISKSMRCSFVVCVLRTNWFRV